MASNKNNDILTTVPSMKDLHSIVIPRVAAWWNTIAHYMDFEIHEINVIKRKCRDDPEECCTELFVRWIQQQNSWKMLLTILKQIRQLAAVTERIEKDVSQLHFTADLPMLTTDKKERKIPKENLMYVLDDLILQTKDLLEKFDKNILDEHRDKTVINGVRLLLMVVNSSEFYAAMNYFSKNKARKLDSVSGNIYYVGEWGENKIPAALIQQSKPGISGPDGSQQLTIASINLFKKLEVIIALGVCGTMGRLGDVIVSSQIDGCDDIKIHGCDIQIVNRGIKCCAGRKIYKTLKHMYETWSFPCTKQETEKHESKALLKPMLSGVPLVASAEYRDRLKSSTNTEAVGLEMEGIGVIHGITTAKKQDTIEFIIVKAGCDYADESKNKEWQPVAAMAAAYFVYHQLSKHSWLSESSGDVHTENKQDDASDKSIDQTTSDTVRSKEGPTRNGHSDFCLCIYMAVLVGVIAVVYMVVLYTQSSYGSDKFIGT